MERLLGKIEFWTRDSFTGEEYTVHKIEIVGDSLKELDRVTETIDRIRERMVDPAMRSAFPKEKGE